MKFEENSIPVNLNNNSIKPRNIRFFHTGEVKNPWILFLHGFPDTPHSWFDVIKNSKTLHSNYYCIMPYLRGYGTANHPKGGYRANELALEMIQFIKELSEKENMKRPNFNIVGHDWGGVITWSMLNNYSSSIQSASILSVPHPKAVGKWLKNRDKKAQRYIRFVKLMCNPLFPFFNLFIRKQKRMDAFYYKELVNKEALTDEIKNRNNAHFNSVGKVKGPLQYYKTNFMGDAFKKLAQSDQIIEKPVLLLFGEKDSFMDLLPLKESKNYLTENNYLILTNPDAGHWLQWDKPKWVAEHIESFLTQSDS